MLLVRAREAAVFVLFCRMRRGCALVANTRAALSRSSFKSRMPGCQPGDAGAIPADRTKFPKTRRAPACAVESPKLRPLGAAPRRRAKFQQCGVAKWEGTGLISRLRAGSIDSLVSRRAHPFGASSMSRGSRRLHSRPRDSSSWAARSFRRSPALQAGEHGAKPWRSTISTNGLVVA